MTPFTIISPSLELLQHFDFIHIIEHRILLFFQLAPFIFWALYYIIIPQRPKDEWDRICPSEMLQTSGGDKKLCGGLVMELNTTW